MATPSRPCSRGPGGRPCGRYRRGSTYDPQQCLRCWRAGPHTPATPEPAEGPLSPPRRRIDIPCVHLGGETGELVECPTCSGRVQIRLRECAVYGSCSPRKAVAGVQCCDGCERREPNRYTIVAPLGTRGIPAAYRGRVRPYPWEYRVSACIPHLGTPAALAAVIETLRWQTLRPYIMVIDTGSPPDVCEQLERLRAEDVEIHYLRAHGYVHSSEPVAVALDVAHALTRTEWLYHTHADCFTMRRDWIEWLWERCSEDMPVIGYQMSERQGTDMWRGTASHTATMLHMPTMRRIGGSYSLQAWYDESGMPEVQTTGWPDTESRLRDVLDRAGIRPYLIDVEGEPGALPELNHVRTTDQNVDHARSYPSSQIYGRGIQSVPEAQVTAAIAEALARAAAWRAIAERGQR